MTERFLVQITHTYSMRYFKLKGSKTTYTVLTKQQQV